MWWWIYAVTILGFLGLFAAYRSYVLEKEVKKRTERLEKEVAERIKAEEKLKKYERFFRNAEDVFFIVDARGRFVDINPKFAEKLGYNTEDLLGKTARNIVHPEDFTKLKNLFKSVLKGEVRRDEIRFITKDGKVIWCDVVEWPVYDNNKIVEVEGVVRDITKRKEMEEKLKEVMELLRLINRMLRHDVLNNLTAIKGFLELYLETKNDELIHRAMKSIDGCVDIIRRMRELELLVTTGGKLKPMNVREVVENVAKNYDVQINVSGDCKVLADEGLYSIINNIFSNAVKHAKTDRIDVTIKPIENFCELRIADYGKGIPSDLKHKIFEEGFSYGDSAGSGLGLFITMKLVERYGGEVRIEDNKPKGSVFIIKLRRATDL